MSAGQIIHLERDDDIDVVREKLERAQARQVLLVVPHGSQIFQSPLDFRLLRRQAQRLALEVGLISNHPAIRDLAVQEGVRVYGSVWQGKRSRRLDLRFKRPPRSPSKRKIPLWRRMRRPRRGNGGCSEQLAAILLILLTVAAVYGLFFYVVPMARVTLVPATQPVQTQLDVVASRDVEETDQETGYIPARVIQVQVEEDGQVPTTGTRDAPDSLATGNVVFINQLSEPVKVLTNTVVATSLGTVARFRTTEAVELAAAIGARATAPIEALESGSSGNVAANLINTVEGPMSLQVRVINPAPTSGGGFRQVGAVTAADKTRLRSLLLQQLEQRGLAEIQKDLAQDQVVLDETVQIDAILAEDYDQFVGEPAEFLGLKMRALVSALIFDQRDVSSQAFRALRDVVPSEFRLVSGSETVEGAVLAQVLPEERQAILTVTASALSVATIDLTEVRSLIRGQQVELARLALGRSLPLAELPEIWLGPEWMNQFGWPKTMPQLGIRILVDVRQAAPVEQVRGE
ncbi:MAG: baseplate J/gp47 family protein [Chloroflexota bacterium]